MAKLNAGKSPLWKRLGRHFKTHVVTGLFAIVPAVVTFFVLKFLFALVKKLLVPAIYRFVHFHIPGLDLLLTLVLIYLMGVLFAAYMGKQLLRFFEGVISMIPLVRDLYWYAKNMLEVMAVPERMVFKKPVLVPWPAPGMWTPGFVTGRLRLRNTSEDLVMVYVPTPPNPINGWTTFVKESDLRETNLTVEEVVRMEFSGGFLTPPQVRLAPWSPPRHESTS